MLTEQYGLFLLLLLALLGGWECSVRLGLVPFFILPAPTSVARALGETRGLLLGRHLPATVSEVALGFLLSVVVGTLLAVGMHMYRTLDKALYPFVVISQTIPADRALAGLHYVVRLHDLEQGRRRLPDRVLPDRRQHVLTGLARATPVTGSCCSRWARAGGRSSARWMFRSRCLPSSPGSSCRSFTASSVRRSEEWLGGSKGLGYFSRRMSGSLQTDAMFAAVFLLSALGIVLFLFIALLEKITAVARKRTDYS